MKSCVHFMHMQQTNCSRALHVHVVTVALRFMDSNCELHIRRLCPPAPDHLFYAAPKTIQMPSARARLSIARPSIYGIARAGGGDGGGGGAAARDTRGGTALPCPHAHILDAVAVGEGGV